MWFLGLIGNFIRIKFDKISVLTQKCGWYMDPKQYFEKVYLLDEHQDIFNVVFNHIIWNIYMNPDLFIKLGRGIGFRLVI